MTFKGPFRIPPIMAVMTPFPWKVRLDDSLVVATEMMRDHDIRHLPVTNDGDLVGIVTERDIRLVENAVRENERRDALRVRDVCVLDAYVVDLAEPLDRVLAAMAARHIGSALVVKGGKLAGIFTSTDVCEQFVRLLEEFCDSDDDDDIA